MSWVDRLPNAVGQMATIGVMRDDSQRVRVAKASLTLLAMTVTVLGAIWSAIYFSVGLPFSASIPGGYSVMTVASLVLLARTKRYDRFRQTQMVLFLLLPFLLMWTLGGFANGSAVALWSISAVILALYGPRPWPWLIGFLAFAVFSGVIDGRLAASAPEISEGVISAFFVLNFVGVSGTVFVSLLYFVQERDKIQFRLAEQHRLLEIEQERSERLLLNILPQPIAERLKAGESVIADAASEVSILFSDIVGFTPMSEKMTPRAVVELLNELFSAYDDLAAGLGVEKIRTTGDGYMVVSGVPVTRADHLRAIAEMALRMQATTAGIGARHGGIELRIGIDTGPVVAGVIGKKKFSYDLWGTAVNTASRMESLGVPGRIQVTERVYLRLREDYALSERGVIDVKGFGQMTAYFLDGHRSDATNLLVTETGDSRAFPSQDL